MPPASSGRTASSPCCCDAAPELGDGFQQMLRADEPDEVFDLLRANPPPDWPAVFLWLDAVRKAHVYLLSGLPAETAEGLVHDADGARSAGAAADRRRRDLLGPAGRPQVDGDNSLSRRGR